MRLPLPLRGAAALAAAGALVLAGCGSGDPGGTGDGATMRTFTDDRDERIEIPEDPERIVATGYAVPALLEAEAPLVGISEWGRGTALMTKEDLTTYEELEKVAGESADSTDYDAVAALDPDLIVIGVPMPVLEDLNLDRLEDLAPVVVLGPSRPDDWKKLTKDQSDAAGVLEGYEEHKRAYEKRAGELRKKYAEVLEDEEFGHLGGYGDASAGNFHREFAGSWGTNIAGDIGVEYPGKVKKPVEGSGEVSEYPALEELPDSLGSSDWLTYTVQDDGTPDSSVEHVLDSELWASLEAVRDEQTIPLKYTEAATYTSAMKTLEAIDTAFEKAFADTLEKEGNR